MSCNLLRMMNVFLLVLIMVKPVTRMGVMRMGVIVPRAPELILLNDSGVSVLEIFKSYDAQTHLYFKEEHAKPIRVALTYYLCTYEKIQLLLPAIRDIARQCLIFHIFCTPMVLCFDGILIFAPS